MVTSLQVILPFAQSSRIEIRPDGCWEWTGALTDQGYGHVRIHGKDWKVHLLVAQVFFGPLKVNQECDHLCRLRSCCNPSHIEYTTHTENVRRGQAGRWNAAKTHCPKGHEYTPENTHIGSKGSRFCRECNRLRKRKQVVTKHPE